MQPKSYSLNTLMIICSNDVAGTPPEFQLSAEGLMLKRRRPTPGQPLAERNVLEWHARADVEKPALPVPFTAYDLAAFTLAGMGMFVLERFERFDDDALDDAALADLGDNGGAAREVLQEANRLRLIAREKFGTDDAGVRKAAHWLLHDAHSESGVQVEGHTTYPTGQSAPLTWTGDDAVISLLALAPIETRKFEYPAFQTEPLSAGGEIANSDAGQVKSPPSATMHGPAPLTTPKLAEAFANIKGKSAQQWTETLGDVNNHQWMLPAIAVRSTRKPNPSTWWPIKFAELLSKRNVTFERLDRLFANQPLLKPWMHEWQEARRERNGFGR